MEIQEIITREEVCERKVEEMGGRGKLRMNLMKREETQGGKQHTFKTRC